MDQPPKKEPDLSDLLRQGDEDAAALFFQRYGERVIGLARRLLDDRLRGKVDPEDVLQSVLRSFYRRHAEGQWDFHDEKGLWRLLVRLTIRKCHRHLEHFQTAGRDLRREVGPVDEALPVIDPEPTPEEAALLVDAVERLMRRLRTEVKQRILELSLKGYSVVEISEQLGYYERGVERVRAEIRALLKAMMADDRPQRD
ncbi:MAG: RNA polymerase sigma factor [Gemmataceae bacterium]